MPLTHPYGMCYKCSMTPRQIFSIDFNEIKTIEITCGDCGSAISLKLPKLNLPRGTQHCPNCNAGMWDEQHPIHAQLQALLRNLSNWQKATDYHLKAAFVIENFSSPPIAS